MSILSQSSRPTRAIREVKFDVYGKRQTAKIKLLPSIFSSLYSRIEIFVFAVNSKRHLYIGVRAFFCQGGGGGEPSAQKILTSCPNFTKQSKGNEGHTMH